MPGKSKSRGGRSCKDLSNVQDTINFPIKKSSTIISKSKKSTLNSPVTTKKTYPNRKRGVETKTITDESNENICCSPTKSPRKEFTQLKSPLADRTNSQCNTNNQSNIPECEVEQKHVRRNLSLSCPEEDNPYTKVCQVLHNSIPKELVCREKELKVLKEFVESCIIKKKPGSMYICGAPGTGKTACLTKVLDENKGLKIKTIFLNCMSLRHSQSIFSKVASLIDKKGCACSNQEGFKYLEKKLTIGGERILLVLDEIDQLESKDQEVLYKLFEMPFIPKSRLVLVGIANSLDFTDRILPRLQTKTSCKPILLQFQPYRKDEICAILQGRIKETTDNIIDQSAVQFCARKVSAMTGDARKALDILRRAVEIVDGDSKKSTSPVKGGADNIKVTIGHVAAVCSDVYSTQLAATNKVKFVFPLQQQVIICTLLSCLKHSKVKEIVLSKLYTAYCRVCNMQHLTPIGQGEFNGICDLLDSQGIVSIKKAKDVQNNKVTLRVQEAEIEHSLQDKSLMVSILSSGISA